MATHIRAGEITLRRIGIGALQYEITMRIYYDTNFGINNTTGEIFIFSGNNPNPVSFVIPQISRTFLAPQVDIGIFKGNYTFPSAGEFTLSYSEQFRNGSIINMFDPNGTEFSVRTTFTIFPASNNNTPELLVPPIDIAFTNQVWIHNPGAFDVDGDSLSYRLTVPSRDINTPVSGYQFPNSPSILGNNPASTFVLDPITGTLTWNAPRLVGVYNVAFFVDEWRRGVRMSSTMRDMQIIVGAGNNQPPQLNIPRDTCVVAGTNLVGVISATDPNNDSINLSAFGGPFMVNNNPATFTVNNPMPSGGNGVFQWQTNCTHVRAQPYQVVFRAEDKKTGIPQGLADIKAWNVTVIGPPPNLTTAAPTNKAVQLIWNPYTCTNAIRMEIWRKEGPPGFSVGPCQQGMPLNSGFIRIAIVNIGGNNPNTYLDSLQLKRGTNYCYVLVAEFPLEGRGRSIPSNEVCVRLDMDVPVITNADITNTDSQTGSVRVAWTPPKGLDSTIYTPPYRYILERATAPSAQFTVVFNTTDLLDTAFVDNGLNTLNLEYRYRISFLYGQNLTLREQSSIANTVRLNSVPGIDEIVLNWKAEVPWDFRGLYQYVYREISGTFTLIDSVLITNNSNLSYIDGGSFGGIPIVQGEVYCYYVMTVGSYFNPLLPTRLFNASQIICVTAKDTIPPCTQGVELRNYSCEAQDFGNTLEVNFSWFKEVLAGCTDDVASYNIYYSPTQEGSMALLANTTDTFFRFTSSTNVAGCYALRVVDISGNESNFSNRICVESCPYYELPNFISPNGDGKNDRFMPLPTPRFVEKVVFRVFNRWGRPVFFSDNNIMLNWPGTSTSGQKLPDGVYFYTADVTFFSINTPAPTKLLKGWIQILSSDNNVGD